MQFFGAHLVIELGRISPLNARQLAFGEGGFDSHHGCGFVRGVGRRVADQFEDSCDMCDIRFAKFIGLGVVLGVVVAIGKAESALIDLGDDLGRVLKILVGTEGKQSSSTVEGRGVLGGGDVCGEVFL